jgi:hypothetical protein
VKSGKIREGCTADNAAGTLVGHAQDDPATAFVRQGGAVLEELLEVKVLLGFLKLQVLAFRHSHPLLEFAQQGTRVDILAQSREIQRRERASGDCRENGDYGVCVAWIVLPAEGVRLLRDDSGIQRRLQQRWSESRRDGRAVARDVNPGRVAQHQAKARYGRQGMVCV